MTRALEGALPSVETFSFVRSSFLIDGRFLKFIGGQFLFTAYIAVTIALGLLVYLLRHGRIANVALMVFSLSLCLTAIEGYYRFFYIQSDGFGRLMKNFADRYYRFDSYGLRDSHLPLSETKANLVVVGDSHVFGAGLKFTSERFSERLAARYPDLHVINLGLPGWDTKTETARLTEYLGHRSAPIAPPGQGHPPRIQLVVLTYFFNDIEEDVTAGDRERITGPIPPAKATAADAVLQWISKYSRFVELFYYRIGYPRLVRDRLDQIQMFYKDPAIMSRHLATLEQFRSVVEGQYSARLLVVILPYLHSDALLNKTSLYRGFAKKLSEHDFNYIDMQPIFAAYGVQKLRVNRFDPHTNSFANQLIAGTVIAFLDQHPEKLHFLK
jgi:hypothetical protein